jgi:hypothetical protein
MFVPLESEDRDLIAQSSLWKTLFLEFVSSTRIQSISDGLTDRKLGFHQCEKVGISFVACEYDQHDRLNP